MNSQQQRGTPPTTRKGFHRIFQPCFKFHHLYFYACKKCDDEKQLLDANEIGRRRRRHMDGFKSLPWDRSKLRFGIARRMRMRRLCLARDDMTQIGTHYTEEVSHSNHTSNNRSNIILWSMLVVLNPFLAFFPFHYQRVGWLLIHYCLFAVSIVGSVCGTVTANYCRTPLALCHTISHTVVSPVADWL